MIGLMEGLKIIILIILIMIIIFILSIAGYHYWDPPQGTCDDIKGWKLCKGISRRHQEEIGRLRHTPQSLNRSGRN